MLDISILGERLSSLIRAGQIHSAYALLAPVLAERTPFTTLDRIGKALGSSPLEEMSPFLEHIAVEKTMGGWAVIGSALGTQLSRDPAGAFDCCRSFILLAGVWYGTDILGERVPGPALVTDFQPSLALLAPWREDANRWVRRVVGVAVHFWAKRSRGKKELLPQGEVLLTFLEPMFEEREVDAIKGVGWGLKKPHSSRTNPLCLRPVGSCARRAYAVYHPGSHRRSPGWKPTGGGEPFFRAYRR